jgi:hypothetical protein
MAFSVKVRALVFRLGLLYYTGFEGVWALLEF